LHLIDNYTKYAYRVVENLLIKIDKFNFSINFVVFNMTEGVLFLHIDIRNLYMEENVESHCVSRM